MSTVAIIGDVGGHADQLERCLAAFGVTATSWPEGLMVVQLGDLLGGVDDQACVEIAAPHVEAGRWLQLLGNWDSRQLGGWWFSSAKRGEPDPDAEEWFLHRYVLGEAFHAAAVTTKAGNSAVITHAGVTAPFWRRCLGSVSDPVEAVMRLNSLEVPVLHQPGQMLGMAHPAIEVDFIDVDDEYIERAEREHPPVGPVWADTSELWYSWLHTPSPWPQVHGHTTAWFRDDWSRYAPVEARPYAERNHRLRHTVYRTDQGSGPPLFGIDCGVWAAPELVLHPLVIPNAKVTVGVPVPV